MCVADRSDPFLPPPAPPQLRSSVVQHHVTNTDPHPWAVEFPPPPSPFWRGAELSQLALLPRWKRRRK
ncbi:hypothetical protein CEXT_534441 [Caerostris extrusa]|uniref:Uncharacterized protein n=1 Tax=Caerostris extrusa TaxID=172846 RepID=A0AAV4XG71_CAEEX|nr:hypothetical protein CEXT_534441 [Caerostris extrusa]